MAREKIDTIAFASLIISIVISLIVLSFFVGGLSKQVDINTGLIANFCTTDDLQKLENQNNKDHMDIKETLKTIDKNLDDYILQKNKVAFNNLYNDYFGTGIN